MATIYDNTTVIYDSTSILYDGIVIGTLGPEETLASTANIKVTGTVTGIPEGQQVIDWSLVNSTSPGGVITNFTVTTASTLAAAFTQPTDGRFLCIIPASTQTAGLRIAGNLGDAGVPLSSQGMSLITLPGAETIFLFTTGSTQVPVRLITY